MLIIFNVSSANSAGADASAVSGFAKKPKAVVNALRSKAFLRVDTASFSTSSFDEEEEEQISRSLIAQEEDTFFLLIIIFIPLLLAFLVEAFCSREKPPDDFDDAPRQEERDRDEGIVADAEKEEEMFIVFRAYRRGKKMDKLEKI